ncbi:UNVERIFIED_CONTAM: hypothetical protein FKN15_043174 [Acipenser sinensis]
MVLFSLSPPRSVAGVSLPSTPISRAVPPPRSRYTVTPLALPVVCPAVVPLSVNQCGARVNPLHPPAERRRTVSLETLAAHHYNQQRVQVMQQKEYCRNIDILSLLSSFTTSGVWKSYGQTTGQQALSEGQYALPFLQKRSKIRRQPCKFLKNYNLQNNTHILLIQELSISNMLTLMQ